MKIARFEFALFGINTYAVFDPESGDCAIIDPGMSNAAERDAVVNFVKKNSLHVVAVVNTHLHIDHAISDKWTKDTFSTIIAASPEDLPLGQNLSQQARMFGLPVEVDAVEIDRPLKDGDTIRIGDGELKVIAVPGHSPGGIALYDQADGFLVSGDSLFAGSIGRTDLPGGDHRALIENIRARLLTLPPETIVYPGHGSPTTIGHELRSNPFLG